MPRLLNVRKRAKVAPAEAESSADAVDPLAQELEGLRLFRASILQPVSGIGTFNLLVPGAKLQLARQLWSGDYASSMAALREANASLVEVLSAQVANRSMAQLLWSRGSTVY